MAPKATTDEGFLAKMKNHDYREKILYTTWIAIALFTQGNMVGLTGPTFLDLQIITGTDVQQASWFFTALSCGFMLGAALIGVVGGRLNKTMSMFISTLGMSVCAIATPYCHVFTLMIVVKLLDGMSQGSLACVANAEHMRVWGDEGRALLQLLHLATAIGAVVAPLYTSPFLAPRLLDTSLIYAAHGGINSTSNTGANFSSDFGLSTAQKLMSLNELSVQPPNNTDLISDTAGYNISLSDSDTFDFNLTTRTPNLVRETDVGYAFWIAGIIAFVTALPFLYEMLRTKNIKKQNRKSDISDSGYRKRMVPTHITVILGLGYCCYQFLVGCIEVSFFSYLMTFIIGHFDDVSKSQGAFITAVYWAGLTGARFCLMFIARVISPSKILSSSFVILTIALVSFLAAANAHSITGVTILTAVMALGLASVFPTGFSWCESRLMPVTPRLASIIITTGSMGAMINPQLIGSLVEHDAMWFCYVLLIEMCVLNVIFLTVNLFNNLYVVKRFGPVRQLIVEIRISPAEELNHEPY